MDHIQVHPIPHLHFFDHRVTQIELPRTLNDPFATVQEPLAIMAVEQLQSYLSSQEEWRHDFGISGCVSDMAIGKMFGVLVVRTAKHELGFLAAFSGKLAGTNNHSYFVPPVFDALAEDGFLQEGMEELKRMSQEISVLESNKSENTEGPLSDLIEARASHSKALQDRLFDSYLFLNSRKEVRGLKDTFEADSGLYPPTAAGECAAPKLLQYAFSQGLEPLSIAEFWWGASTRSVDKVHGNFYPACLDKCGPILRYMLG